MIHKFDVIVLGAGAAGLMCAIEAGKRGRSVAIIERGERAGEKILISGGGRCNFTNIHCQPDNFISANPHFATSALARYTPSDFIAMVERHGIPYHEKTLGQLFCDQSAQNIVTMLQNECQVADAKLFPNGKILKVTRGTEFIVRTDAAEFRGSALVVATGGLSIPKLGATMLGYDLATQFGLKIRPTKPALVPLLFNEEDRARFCDLAGVSTEVVAATNGQSAREDDGKSSRDNDSQSFRDNDGKFFRDDDGKSFKEKMLITHRGLSGPAMLQISSYWADRRIIRVDLAPDRDVTAAIRDAKVRNLAAARLALHEALPKRLAARWIELHPPASWTNQGLAEFERQLHSWSVVPAGTEGYAKAEVTAGGVDTDELSSKTMECRKVPGLFFIGEVVDVTGQLGGFNFQWAWASGAAAGRSV